MLNTILEKAKSVGTSLLNSAVSILPESLQNKTAYIIIGVVLAILLILIIS